MRRAIGEIAAFVTSKNAGPFLLTLDIVFPDRSTDERFKALKALEVVDDEFNIHHLVAVDDPLELFPVEIIEP